MNTQAYWEGYAEACLAHGADPMALQKQAGMGDYMPSKEQLMAFAKDPRTIGGAAGAGLGAIGGGLYGGGQGALMGGLGGAALGVGGGQLYDQWPGYDGLQYLRQQYDKLRGKAAAGGEATPTVRTITPEEQRALREDYHTSTRTSLPNQASPR